MDKKKFSYPAFLHIHRKFFHINACKCSQLITFRLSQKDVLICCSGGSGGAGVAVDVIGSWHAELIDMLSPNSPEISALDCSSDKSRAGLEMAEMPTFSIISWAMEDRRRLPIFWIMDNFRKTSSKDSALYWCRRNCGDSSASIRPPRNKPI